MLATLATNIVTRVREGWYGHQRVMRIGFKATEGCFKSNSTIILSLALKKPSLERVVTRFVQIPLSPGAKYEF